MGDIDKLKFGKNCYIDLNNFKAGICKKDLTDQRLISIFSAYDDGNGVWDENELQNFKNDLLEAASEDGDNEALSKAEAKSLFEKLGIKNIRFNSLVNFAKSLQKIHINGEIEHVEQGDIGACWLVAQINSLSETDFGAKAIKDAIKDNKDGTYSVVLKGYDEVYTFTEEEIEAADKSGRYSKGDYDVILLELALEKHYKNAFEELKDTMTEEEIQKYTEKSNILDGGDPSFAKNYDNKLTDHDLYFILTGKRAQIDIVNDFCKEDALILKAKNPNDVSIVFGSMYDIEYKEEFDNDGMHEYHVKSVELDENGNIKNIIVVNPWDNNHTISMTLEEFQKVNNSGFTFTAENDDIREDLSNSILSKYVEMFFNDELDFTEKGTYIHCGIEKNPKAFIEKFGGVKAMMESFIEAYRKELQGNMTDKNKEFAMHWFLNMIFKIEDSSNPMVKDILEHPEKLAEYCEQYGYKYE